MKKAAPSTRWFAVWRTTERPAQVDWADQGTAFGLDQSLNEVMHEPPPVASAERRPGWMRRLARWDKPAA